MFAKHPGLAREFEAATPKGVGLPRKLGGKHPANPPSVSNESPAPNRARVRRMAARDFVGAHAGLERAAMKQGPVSALEGSRGTRQLAVKRLGKSN